MTMINGLISGDRESWKILAWIVEKHYINHTTVPSGAWRAGHHGEGALGLPKRNQRPGAAFRWGPG
jgi:hypothetical protein